MEICIFLMKYSWFEYVNNKIDKSHNIIVIIFAFVSTYNKNVILIGWIHIFFSIQLWYLPLITLNYCQETYFFPIIWFR